MNSKWNYFAQWELSHGNKWSPIKARGLKKVWNTAVKGEIKQLLSGGDNDCLIAFCGKDSVLRLNLQGEELWKTSLFEGGPPMKEYDFPPHMIDGAWFYRETLFAQMAGVAPIQLNPVTGQVLRRMKYGSAEDPFDPMRNYGTSLYLEGNKWHTVTGPTTICEIERSGYLKFLGLVGLPPCLGWEGLEVGGVLFPPLHSGNQLANFSLNVLMKMGGNIVFGCDSRGPRNRHLRIATDGDYYHAFIVKDAVDAFITNEGGYLVTQHHDENLTRFWLECRQLSDPERVVWRTEDCGWMIWSMGSGDTVWHHEWCGPFKKGKDWLVGRDLQTGVEIYRKAEACRFMGMFCGPYIITASGRSITAWEPVP